MFISWSFGQESLCSSSNTTSAVFDAKKHLSINSQVSQIQGIKEQTRGCLGCVEADYILLGWTGVASGREPIGGTHPTISHDGRVSIHQPPWVFQDTDEYKQNAWERLRKKKGPAACHMFFFQRKFSVGGKKRDRHFFRVVLMEAFLIYLHKANK